MGTEQMIEANSQPIPRLLKISQVAKLEGCSHDAIRKHYPIVLNGFGMQCVEESEIIKRREKFNSIGLKK